MSYYEYLDMFNAAQQKPCPYRAFCFDVAGSKTNAEYISNRNKFFELIFYVKKQIRIIEHKQNSKILLCDENNKPLKQKHDDINSNNYNPMILGDMVTYFVYNNSISPKKMQAIFADALNKFDIGYSFHFSTGIYETNTYADGGEKLYKGYMPQILEKIGKTNNIIISKNSELEKEI